MRSVFSYRAPRAEDKVHLEALQAEFLTVEGLMQRARQLGELGLPLFHLGIAQLGRAIEDHVPAGHEREVADLRRLHCRSQVLLAVDTGSEWDWVWALDSLRECRMWANAGIVLAP